MERLVEWTCKEKNVALPLCINDDGDVVPLEDICAQLATIYDILGDDYDLDRLKVMVNQRMTMREEVSERFRLTKYIPVDRLRELVEAERDERIVILPCKIGTPVWSTVFCHLGDDGKEHPTFPWEFSVSMMDEWGTGWHMTEEAAEAALEGETHD